MNLDDLTAFETLDPQHMIAHIDALPQQLADAWALGQALPLPDFQGVRQIVIAGMGGSAMGADLLAGYAAPDCPLPVLVYRGYDLPAWASGAETLVIAVSHSGDTEETLSAFDLAHARGCRLLALTTGGALAEKAAAWNVPLWRFEHTAKARAAIGYLFGLLLALFCRLGLLPDAAQDVTGAVSAMRAQQAALVPASPVSANPAKRMAGQMMGRWVLVVAADYLGPVALRWKQQINEAAKALAYVELLPEADHNTLAGLSNPEAALMQGLVLFLEAPDNHPRNRLRLVSTRMIFMTQAVNTDVIQARGASRLSHLWTLLHFGDYTSYYLAMACGEDPTPVEAVAMLKAELQYDTPGNEV